MEERPLYIDVVKDWTERGSLIKWDQIARGNFIIIKLPAGNEGEAGDVPCSSVATLRAR